MARAEYETDLYDAQFNRWRPYNDTVSLLFGLRYTLLSEDFNLRGVDGVGQPEGRTEYKVRARNHMIGPQLGIAANKKTNRLSFGLTGKIAPMLNLAYQKQRLKENAVAPLNFFSTNGFRRKNSDFMADLSYIVELGAEVTIRVSDRVKLNLGYMAMFLGEVATAPDNFDFSTNTPQGKEFIDTTANVFYHGGTAMARVKIKLN